MKPVIVVEGTSDVNRLKNIIDCDFVITNGSAISLDTLNYLKELSKFRRIIVFTDPDYPGMQVRNKISQEISNVEHCYIRKEYAIKRNKVGVCECEEKELLRALNEILNFEKQNEEVEKINTFDLVELKYIGSNDSAGRRMFVGEKIPIGKTNGKTFLKRLNQLGIGLEKLKEWKVEYDSK